MTTISEVKQVIARIEEIANAGFAIAFHVRFMTPSFLFQTYPKEWIKIYSENGLVMNDPIVGWGFANTGHKRWSDLVEIDEAGVIEQSKPFGMVYGVAVATEEGDSRSVAGFARSDREFSDEEIAHLEQAVADLHRLTDKEGGMSDEMQSELHSMSVAMTHPSPIG